MEISQEGYESLRVMGIHAPEALKHPFRIWTMLTRGWHFDSRYEVLYTGAGQGAVRVELRFVDQVNDHRWAYIQDLITRAVNAMHKPLDEWMPDPRDYPIQGPSKLARGLSGR